MKLAQLIAKTGEHEATIQVLCHLLKADRTNVFLLKDISDEIAVQTINIAYRSYRDRSKGKMFLKDRALRELHQYRGYR